MDIEVSEKELAEIMASLGMSTGDAAEYAGVIAGNLGIAALLDKIPAPSSEAPEREWRRVAETENRLGAWAVRTNVRGAAGGKLAGRTVAVKDNVLLAGVPLQNGTSVLDGYTPAEDAEIVRRILAEGATIVGKTVCEAYCFSGGSHTSATGPVRNPHDPARSAGGSSSGSGAVVAAGEADLAIGCDQGGSIRMPASFCGIVGMKPTWGLVPYTGVLGMNPNVDHTGPMTANVADNALLLEVLAGADGVDSRQRDTATVAYTTSLGRSDLAGIRVGIVAEGFGTPASEPDVDAAVRAAAAHFTRLGAEVRDVSIPLHALSGGITFGAIQTLTTSMFLLDGCLLERPDVTPEEYVRRQSRWRERADELPANVKAVLITGELMRRRYGYTRVARAMARLPLLRAAYDTVLAEADVLVMPTTPMKATVLPPPDAPPAMVAGLAFAPLTNTAAFNWTHHPALSLPCARREGLPVGMMLVGRHFDEALLYRVGHAFEESVRWQDA